MIAETAFIERFQNGEAPAAHVYFLGLELQTWIEILVSLLIEGVLISLVFFMLSQWQQRRSRRHLQAELKMLEHNMKRNNAELHKMKGRGGMNGN